MSSPAPTSPSPPAGSPSASTPAGKSSKKAAPVRAINNFSRLTDPELVTLAIAVIKGLTGNAAFPNPTVDLAAFGNTITAFQELAAAALDKGKKALAECAKQRKLVIQDLKSLVVYVENNCNNDPAILTSSGFSVKTRVKTADQPVVPPAFKSLDLGVSSGQITVTLKKVTGAKVYFVRYAPMTGGSPGAWTTVPIPKINVKTTFSGLTPGVNYAFETQSLGPIGLSDWSDTTTMMCI